MLFYGSLRVSTSASAGAMTGDWVSGRTLVLERRFLGGSSWTAVATMGMLMTTAYILAMDTFGPITDNAGGIAEFSRAEAGARDITDRLDAVGNTTKALTKGYAIASASLAAFLLFSAYIDKVNLILGRAGKPLMESVNLADVNVFIAALIGSMLAYFFSSLDREIARSDRSGRRFCLLMMDLDGLKTTNDRFGHFVGDRVLRGIGDVIRRGTRKIDTPARYGGDEFVILLPETDPSGAFVLAEKIRQSVSERSFEVGDGGGAPIRASVSVGVVTYPDDGGSADELMISADKAMYAQKRSRYGALTR